MQQKNIKLFIYPLISLGIFIVLVFGAAYAYIAGTMTMNTANYQVVLPSQTSLVCTKTDCSVTITPSQMSNTNTSSSSAKSTNTCSVNCTCSGTPGAVCAYNVFVVEAGTKYTPSASIGSNNEFTVKVTSPSNCTTQNSSSSETQVNTIRGKMVSNCSLTVPAGGSVSANVTAEFKWYNLNIPQDGHASKTYTYKLSTGTTIPDAYQMVEYIQGTGTQYIITDINPTNTMRVEAKVYNPSTYTADSQPTFLGASGFQCYFGGSGPSFWLSGGNGSGSLNNGSKLNDTIIEYAAETKTNGLYLKINSTEKNSSYVYSPSSPGYLYIFSYANGTHGFGGRLYYLRIYNNGTLLREYIPCYIKGNETIGLWETQTSTFYTNQGSGNFTKGPDIQ